MAEQPKLESMRSEIKEAIHASGLVDSVTSVAVEDRRDDRFSSRPMKVVAAAEVKIGDRYFSHAVWLEPHQFATCGQMFSGWLRELRSDLAARNAA